MLWTSIAEWMNFNSVNRKFSLDDWTAFLPIFYPSLCEPVQVQHFEFFVLCWSSNFSIFDPFPAAAWKALWFVTFFFFLLLFSSFTLIYIADIYLMCLFVSSFFFFICLVLFFCDIPKLFGLVHFSLLCDTFSPSHTPPSNNNVFLICTSSLLHLSLFFPKHRSPVQIPPLKEPPICRITLITTAGTMFKGK